MPSPDICACITSVDDLQAAAAVHDVVSLYEVRIDLVGESWPAVAAGLGRPWIACNRPVSEGGCCTSDEVSRLETLRRAVSLGAALVDIEVTAPDARGFIEQIKGRVRVIVSHHDFERTDGEEALGGLVWREKDLGADICKVVTTAQSVDDVGRMLRLVRRFRSGGIVAFAMGPLGIAGRVLAPLAGAAFTYASLAPGHESAPGQLTVAALRDIYDAMGAD